MKWPTVRIASSRSRRWPFSYRRVPRLARRHGDFGRFQEPSPAPVTELARHGLRAFGSPCHDRHRPPPRFQALRRRPRPRRHLARRLLRSLPGASRTVRLRQDHPSAAPCRLRAAERRRRVARRDGRQRRRPARPPGGAAGLHGVPVLRPVAAHDRRPRTSPTRSPPPASRSPERAAQVAAALAQLGLEAYAERRPDALSGGQRQRVALARTLVQDARLVLCDEPLANLDVHLRAATIETFRRLHRETGRTFVYVTHDQAEALALATEIAVLDRGRLAQVGSPGRGLRRAGERDGRRLRRPGRASRCRAPGGGRRERPGAARGRRVRRPRPRRMPGPGRRGSWCGRRTCAPAARFPRTVTGSVFRGAAHEAAVSVGGQTLLLDLPARPEPGAAIGLAIENAWVVPPG